LTDQGSIHVRTARIAAALAAAVLSLTACGSGEADPLATGDGGKSTSAQAGSLTVGSADFPESTLLAEIYAGALEAKGVTVSKRLNIGSREAYIPALQDGSIDLIPEYTGVLAQYFNKDAKATDPDGVYAELKESLPDTLKVLEKSEAQDKDAIVVTKETADRLGLRSITDLEGKAQDMVLGGPPEWKTRATGVPGLKKVYGLEFKSFRPLDAGGPLSVQALKNGQVDAVDLFTTDPTIEANGFVILEDPKNFFSSQNVVPLITKSKSNETIEDALNAVSAKLDTETLGEYLGKVVLDKQDPAAVAKEFLEANQLN
jgi:osmoprotectant transport system substrate-binding protein